MENQRRAKKLNERTEEVLNGQTGIDVTYHETLEEARLISPNYERFTANSTVLLKILLQHTSPYHPALSDQDLFLAQHNIQWRVNLLITLTKTK